MIRLDSGLEDVAFAVCTSLARVGITAVLTGGSAATIHSRGAYTSMDADFILTRLGDGPGKGEAVLLALGYSKVGVEYRHECNPLSLDFPPGPLAVGDELLTEWDTRRRGDEILHLLRAEDSMKDRLAAFLHWDDLRGLDQAKAVWRGAEVEIDLVQIQEWVAREGANDRWPLIRSHLA